MLLHCCFGPQRAQAASTTDTRSKLTRMTALVAPAKPLAFSRWGIWRDILGSAQAVWRMSSRSSQGRGLFHTKWVRGQIFKSWGNPEKLSGVHFCHWQLSALASPEINFWNHVSQLWNWLGRINSGLCVGAGHSPLPAGTFMMESRCLQGVTPSVTELHLNPTNMNLKPESLTPVMCHHAMRSDEG